MTKRSGLIWEERLLGIAMTIMVVMVFVHVIGRYVIHASFSYTEELVRYLFVWCVFLGSSAALYRNSHLSVSLLPESVWGRFARARLIVTWGAAMIFILIMIVFGIRVAFLQFVTGQRTAAMGLPMWWFGLALPVAALSMAVRLMQIRISRERGDE